MTTWLTRFAAMLAVLGAAPLAVPGQDLPVAEEEQPADAAAELDPEIVAAGQVALAEKFAEMAQQALRGGRLDEPEFRQSAALLRAAATLNPGEPRYWRLLTEAELQLGNRDGALSALQGYRKIAPQDRVAQIQLIELHAARMEAGDEALAYLRNLLGKETVPAEVRAHVAVQIARRLLDRGEDAQVPAVLEQAIELNPVNVAALELKYALVSRAADATPPQRAAALLALLRANPIRPAAMAELARLLAGAGMGREALEWFTRATDLYGVAGAPDRQSYHDLVVDYAAQMYLAGQFAAARGVTDHLLESDPGDVDAWLLRLVIDRGIEEKPGEAYAKTLEDAKARLWQRWGAAAREAMGQEVAPAEEAPAGDAPAELDFPEPATVAQHVKTSGDEQQRALLVSAAADFAWFEVYFNEQPGAAGKWIDALEAVLPADSVTLVRLRGWMQIANDQREEAAKTLAPVRDTDPLSALGLLRVAGGEGAGAADAQARKLLSAHPAGLVGAILSQALKSRNLKPDPHPDAAAIRAELKKFPRAWLDIIHDPHRFYAIRVDPLRVAHRFGEPMLVRVTLQNLTDFDIPIGDDGVIRPGLWFDAHAQAMTGIAAPGTAFERLGQATVLPARQRVAQYVRLDQGRLADVLAANPTPQLQITGWCMTNPVQAGEGFAPGPGGVRAAFAKKVARTGFPINRPGALEELVRGVEAGLPETKVRNLNLLGVLVPMLRQGDNAPAPRQDGQAEPAPAAPDEGAARPGGAGSRVAAQFVDAMKDRTADEVPAVAQWARFELAHAGDPGQQAQAIEALLADARWEGRLLGLIVSPKLGAAKAEDAAAKLAETEGEESWVKDYAGALVEVLQRPAAPASQPANAGEGEEQPPREEEGESEAGDVNGAADKGSDDSARE